MNIDMYILIIILIINIVSFIVMFVDKRKAIKHARRISELTLFTYALVLGALGIYFGMYTFRHKTKHAKFTITIPILIVINLITTYYLLQYIN